MGFTKPQRGLLIKKIVLLSRLYNWQYMGVTMIIWGFNYHELMINWQSSRFIMGNPCLFSTSSIDHIFDHDSWVYNDTRYRQISHRSNFKGNVDRNPHGKIR